MQAGVPVERFAPGVTGDPHDEAGTAPADRAFRPDVEGLRAIAILTVVLSHAGVAQFSGGYVGVDVFFVISGFVITGVLLRERSSTGGTSLFHFYARRVRRILPAALLVIFAAVIATYVFVGTVSGGAAANDGRWAAIFLANYHFWSQGTSYFGSLAPPSPLQNFWSLAVEEQFYIVYPTIFLVCAVLGRGRSFRARLSVVLCGVFAASFWLSVTQTSSHPSVAYFSTFTRAWELSLGALVALSTPLLKRLPVGVAAVASWVGLGMVLLAATLYTDHTSYPGSLVAVPVLGAGLIIAGGVRAPRLGAEWLLGRKAFSWVGKRSYSLYLWHWPILIVAAEQAGKSSLAVGENLFLLVVVAVPLAHVTYHLVENPIRHLRTPSRPTVLAGVTVVAVTWLVLTQVISWSTSTVTGVTPAPTTAALQAAVAQSDAITTLPSDVDPAPSAAQDDFPGLSKPFDYGCGYVATIEPDGHLCTIGDPHGQQLMIAYGDSHTIMWIPALNDIAKQEHFRLIVLARFFCPAGLVTVSTPPVYGSVTQPYQACNQWHQWVVRTVKRLKPSLFVISQSSLYLQPAATPSGTALFGGKQWDDGLAAVLQRVAQPGMREFVLGDIPLLSKPAPACLQSHPHDVQLCSTPVGRATNLLSVTEQRAAAEAGAQYVDPVSWFCTLTCSPVIGRYLVYRDQEHITATYAEYAQNALGEALGFPSP